MKNLALEAVENSHGPKPSKGHLMLLTFDADHVRRLLEIAKSSTALIPNYEQIASPDYWRADMDSTRLAMLKLDAALYGVSLHAKAEDVDPAKLVPGIFIVGDEGVYVMANVASDEVKAAGISHTAYARETDPALVDRDTMYSRKRASFGPDDGVDFIPAEMIEHLLPPGGLLRIDVMPDRLDLLTSEPSTSTVPEP